MLWLNSSTTGSRSKGALLLFLLLPGFSAGALEITAQVQEKSDAHVLIVRIKDFPRDQVLKAVEEGFRSEVRYTIQVYRKTVGWFGWNAEELLKEDRRIFTAGWDRFQSEYVVIPPDGGQVSFSTAEVFMQVLNQLSFPLNLPKESGLGYVVKLKVEIMPVKLVAPLNLLTFFTSNYQLASPWKQVEIPGSTP